VFHLGVIEAGKKEACGGEFEVLVFAGAHKELEAGDAAWRVVSGDLVEALAIERAEVNFRLGWRVDHLDGTGEPLVTEVGEMLIFLAGAAPWVVRVAQWEAGGERFPERDEAGAMGVVDGGFAHVDYGVVVEDVVGEEVGVVHMNSRGLCGGLGG
jgi:hypothetical protein